MTVQRVTAHFGPSPRDIRVRLGENDITNALYRVVIQQGGPDFADRVPKITLELAIVDMNADIDGEVDLYIPEPTRKALQLLGWTAPETTP